MEEIKNISEEIHIASYKKRILSFSIDAGLSLLTSIAPYYIFKTNDLDVDFYYIFCSFFFLMGLTAYLFTGNRTPGQNMMKIKVVRQKDLSASKTLSVFRFFIIVIFLMSLYSGNLLNILGLLIMTFAGFSIPKFRENKQLIWDAVSRTIIIYIAE